MVFINTYIRFLHSYYNSLDKMNGRGVKETTNNVSVNRNVFLFTSESKLV